MKQGDKTRLKILEAADTLFYHRGYNSTAISDIVEQTNLSKGNITYHFKSKRDILEGIVKLRLEQSQALLNQWDEECSTPLKRLLRFCDMLLAERENLKQFGCPMGSLTVEFSKNSPELYDISRQLFALFRDWLKKQFHDLGLKPQMADVEAMSLLAKTQGIAVLTQAFKEDAFLDREIRQLKSHLKKLPQNLS